MAGSGMFKFVQRADDAESLVNNVVDRRGIDYFLIKEIILLDEKSQRLKEYKNLNKLIQPGQIYTLNDYFEQRK